MEQTVQYQHINMEHANQITSRIVDTIRVIFSTMAGRRLEDLDEGATLRVPISANALSRHGIGIRSTSNRAIKVLESLGVLENTGETEQYTRVYLVKVSAAKDVISLQNDKLLASRPVVSEDSEDEYEDEDEEVEYEDEEVTA